MTSAPVEIDEAIVGDDGILSLYVKSPDGVTSTVKVGIRAQSLILQALIGSTLDPFGSLARRFQPAGLARFRMDDGVGLSFLLSRQIGVHFILDRSLAGMLKEMLDTFDDPATWDSARLN
jgi:hypothetical protein